MSQHEYKSLRRYVNHDLLRNDFLHRLGVPEIFFSAENNQDREAILANTLESISGSSPNLHIAVTSWTGEDGRNERIDALVMKLYAHAKTLKHVRPTERFPSEELVNAWLQAINEYVEQIKSLSELPLEQRHTLAVNASQALRQLSDFLGAIDIHSPNFWRVFAPDDQ